MIDGKVENFEREEVNENFAEMLAIHDVSAGEFQPGMRVEGTIIDISGDNVFLDIGLKVDGLMDIKDLNDSSGAFRYAVGDKIEAWIISVTASEIHLSRSMIGSGLAALEEACNAMVPVEGKIIGICKGGYVVEVLDKKAFCPGSQLDHVIQSEPDEQIGRILPFLILRIENKGRNIVVSHRALKERERFENMEKVLENLTKGDTVTGQVTRIAPFGAFVEISPGVEGLVHLSELGWSRVDKVEDAVSIGDEVLAVVLDIKKDDKKGIRISLSRKQAEDDPWSRLGESLAIGSVITGKVKRLAPFGAFIELLPGVEGLAHISELAWDRRISKPEEVLKPGDTVAVKIKDINSEIKRISLSVRDAEGNPWNDLEKKLSLGARIRGRVESKNKYGIFVNICPGITGLLPAAIAKTDSELSRLEEGQEADFVIQNIDVSLHRISLAPVTEDHSINSGDTSWREHAGAHAAPDMGIMAQALQKAFEKKR